MAGAAFGDLGVSLFLASAIFGDLGMSLCLAGAIFGDLGVSLFVAGAAFADLAVSLFVAGAVFGDLGASLFVADAVFGEIWVDSRSAKCCNFQYKMPCRGGRSKLCERTGSVLQFHGRIMFGSWLDHARIGRTPQMTLQLFSANFS